MAIEQKSRKRKPECAPQADYLAAKNRRHRSSPLASVIKQVLAGLALSTPLMAQAGGITDFDARALAMGGTGVATAGAGSAAAYNPAMLSLQTQGGHFYLVAPTVGAELYQQDSVLNHIDDIQKTDIPAINNDVNNINSAPVPANYRQFAADLTTFNGALQSINDRNIIANVGAKLSLAVPGPSLGVAVLTQATGQVAGSFHYSAGDQVDVQGYIQTATDGGNSNVAGLAQDCANYPQLFGTGCKLKTPDQVGLSSSANLRGVVVGDGGVSLSHSFLVNDRRVALGITPKLQTVDTFGYSQTVSGSNGISLSNVNESQYRKQYSAFNLDLGAAEMLNERWSAGLDIKNLFGKTYQTVNGYNIDIKPQLAAGLGYRLKYLTLAADLDLSKNDMLHAGDATQYLSLGVEGDALHWLQLRLGYKHNLVSSSAKDMLSAGVGLSPFGVLHIDIAALASSNTVGAVMQLGFSF